MEQGIVCYIYFEKVANYFIFFLVMNISKKKMLKEINKYFFNTYLLIETNS